jgi:hypothetical protein
LPYRQQDQQANWAPARSAAGKLTVNEDFNAMFNWMGKEKGGRGGPPFPIFL